MKVISNALHFEVTTTLPETLKKRVFTDALITVGNERQRIKYGLKAEKSDGISFEKIREQNEALQDGNLIVTYLVTNTYEIIIIAYILIPFLFFTRFIYMPIFIVC